VLVVRVASSNKSHANIHSLDKIFHLPILKNNQISPSHATQETNLCVCPHPKNVHLSQSLKKKPPLETGGIIPSSPLHPKENPFEKEKENFNPSSSFFKPSFTSCNSFNLIELSTPYTH